MKKVKIPKSFTLNLKEITVKYDSERLTEDGRYGEADFEDGEIFLCKEFMGDKLSEHTIITTFYHELAHMLLHAAGMHRLKYNEKLVDKLGLLLYEYEISKK
jgi:predicted SprT family Zn-dependent metalloprotease